MQACRAPLHQREVEDLFVDFNNIKEVRGGGLRVSFFAFVFGFNFFGYAVAVAVVMVITRVLFRGSFPQSGHALKPLHPIPLVVAAARVSMPQPLCFLQGARDPVGTEESVLAGSRGDLAVVPIAPGGRVSSSCFRLGAPGGVSPPVRAPIYTPVVDSSVTLRAARVAQVLGVTMDSPLVQFVHEQLV